MAYSQVVLEAVASNLPLILLASFLLYITGQSIYNLTFHPLASVPGPFLAKISPFYPIYLYFDGKFVKRMQKLHEKHGEFVRLTPNFVAVAAPSGLKQVWATKGMEKGEFYDAFEMKISKTRDLFTIRNDKFHAQRRRLQGNIWSMTSVLEMEQFIDQQIALFMEKMHREADGTGVIDLGLWAARYAYDVIGALFFGDAYGFLDKEVDVDNMMETASAISPYEALLGMAAPWMRPFMMSMVVIPSIFKGFKSFHKIKVKTEELISTRLQEMKDQKKVRPDMMSKMLRIVLERGEQENFTREDVEQESFVAMIAGNDTVAMRLTATLFHLAGNPAALRRLQKELDEGTANGTLSPVIRFQEASALPYLNAVFKEGMRIHAMFGYPLPRVVPAGGAEVCGRFWPGGTALGVSCGVLDMSTEIFGEDAAVFNPDRWMVDEKKAASMWNDTCVFGAGQRACIGQHIARSEIFKIVAQFIREFDVEPRSEWKSLERWFNKPQDTIIKVSRRVKAQ